MNNQNIMPIKHRFNHVIEIMNHAGYAEISDRLEKELNALNSNTYKIAVAGEFKTGKSTLINRLFLKEDVLFTDIMEASAVPVEISYGTKKLLEIIPCAAIEAGDDILFTNAEAGEPIMINNPDSEHIRSYTSAATPEGRARLAGNTFQIKLFWPANNLEGLTIFDTPGINSMNAAVIATTYRILPKADLLLFVTGAKQLSNVELEFFSSRIFSQGISRVIVIVTYAPDSEDLSDNQRERLTETIRGQLSNIGQDNIPVEAVNILDYSSHLIEAQDESFRNRVDREKEFTLLPDNSKQGVSDVISDLLGEKKSPAVSEFPVNIPDIPKPGTIALLEKKLISFIRNNVRPGRAEKAEKVLNLQIQLALVQCETELSAMNKDRIQRLQMLSDIKVREAEMRLKYEKLSVEFKNELQDVEQRFALSAQKGLGRIAELYIAGFDVCQDLGELQNRLKDARFYLKRKVEEMFMTCSQQAEEDIRELVKTYGIKSRTLLNPWHSEVSRELDIDGGIFAKIPPFALLAFDIMLFVRFGPFGPLADILIRLLANYIPFLNRALPVSLAASVLKKKIRNSLETEFETIKKELPDLIKINFDALVNNIMDEWSNYADQQIGTIRKSVEKIAVQPADEKRQALLREMQYKLEAILT